MENDEKRAALTAIMNEIVDRLRKDRGFDWMPIYAQHFVDIWGKNEASRQCRAIMNERANVANGDGGFDSVHISQSPNTLKFCQLVSDKIHRGAQ